MAAVRYAPEWVALLEGLKPARRVWCSAARAHREADAARRRGFATTSAELPDGAAILYLARTPSLAASLRALEADVLPARSGTSGRQLPHDVMLARHRDLGLALGFPPCCIDGFVDRLHRGVNVVAGDGGAHEDFGAAVEALARTRRWHPRLNMVPLDRGATWLSHVPCSFDCPRSLAFVDALATAYARLDRGGAAAIDAALAVPVAITRRGERVAPAAAPASACRLPP